MIHREPDRETIECDICGKTIVDLDDVWDTAEDLGWTRLTDDEGYTFHYCPEDSI